jgi:hypothetical protein
MSDLTLVKYLKADRGPQGNYAPGDIAGFEPEVAKKLMEQGFAKLHDAGKGLGKVNPLAIAHLREPWEAEDDPAWLERAKTVEAAKADHAAQAAKSR